MHISERVYILRRGRLAGEKKTAAATKEELANLMVGRDVVLTVRKEEHAAGDSPVFVVDHITIKNDQGIDAINELCLDVRAGEIVGIAGVDGNGQAELAQGIIGLRALKSGSILFKGKSIDQLSTRERIKRKFCYVPADRQRYGLVLPMKVSENCIIGNHDGPPYSTGFALNLEYIDGYAETLANKFDIRTPSVSAPVANLSGGNQQKVILAREFSRSPEFLLVSQPTRGLDVGAIEYIHSQVLKMRDLNVAILLISLELEEIFALSDKILVLYEGRIVKELVTEETDEKEVGLYMTGGKQRSHAHADT